MSSPPTIRLFLFHARESTRTVILRQGASKLFRMILWDRKDDSFEDGQWLKQKVYTERCDISPDGRHFIYFTYHTKTPGLYTYTAVSRIPYFSALALFPELAAAKGGGHFLDTRHYVILNWQTPENLKPGVAEIEHVLLAGTHPARFQYSNGKKLSLSAQTQAWADSGCHPLSLDEYETEGPNLYRIKKGQRHLIRNFGDMVFEPIVAPYPTFEPWHPLDKDCQ